MQYRTFGQSGWQVSALGFGCMRLPTLAGDSANIDEAEATRMVRHAIDQGVNYLDTAYGYHRGNSERFLGRALKDGYRERVTLATKLPCWLVKSREDFDTYLNEQLGKLQTDHVDVYLLHGLGAERWHAMRDLGVIAWAEGAMADGRIRRLGFSFHDKFDVFKEIVDAYDGWAMCQVQYNYMDVAEQAGMQGVHYAASRGLAVVAMEPLLGGRLAHAPESIQKLWAAAPAPRTPADWALQWLWSQPEVSVVLSGMSAMSHVTANIDSAGRSAVGLLSAPELALIDRVRAAYQALSPIPCTKCEYCLPCPSGITIPRLFELLNTGAMYGALDDARRWYAHIPEAERASACVQCLQCESLCPQAIPISEWMATVQKVLGEGQPLPA